MKRGKSISDWMTSALAAKGNTEGSQKAPPTSHHKAPPTSSQPPRKSKRSTTKPDGRPQRGDSPIPSATPLTAGTLPAESDIPWAAKYCPQTAAELAVHKKKVSEVETWLEFALSPQARHPILLLIGPPGCGKTATLHALSKDMGVSVVEWVNPSSEGGARGIQERGRNHGDIVLYPESQWKQFQGFLVRANRYPGLQMVGGEGGQSHNSEQRKKKVVLVEEFPNTFIREPTRFYDIMRSLTHTLHYPLVFIASESHSKGSSPSTIFSKAALAKMDIHTINFNPIAHTNLVKALQRIASVECQKLGVGRRASSRGQQQVKFHMPPRDVIESLAESSAGDIRSAINSLQFACLRDPRDLSSADAHLSSTSQRSLKRHGSTSSVPGSGARPRRQLSEAELSAIGGRDCSLFLFRALGRILYCKRRSPDEGGELAGPSLPNQLQHHWRAPLLDNPESVIDHTHMSPELFVLYLHQNYLDFFEDMEDVAQGSEYLSVADVLGRVWSDSQTGRFSPSTCAGSVACRGLMFSNTHRPTSGGKWRPLYKPHSLFVSKKYLENCQAARSLFLHLGSSPHAHLWTPVELQTEILPYLAMINVPLRNHGQASLLQTLTYFTSGYHRSRPEALGEKDVESSLRLEGTDVEHTMKDQILESESPGLETDRSGMESNTAMAADEPGQLSSQEVGAAGGWSQDVGKGDSDVDIEDFDDDIIW